MCLWLQIKIRNSTHGLRRSIICAKGVSKASPSCSLYFEIFFVRFLLLIVGHCIPFGSVCLALRFILLKYDIWALLKIKCFLQQVVRDRLKTKANMRALRVWTIPERLLLTILPSAFFSHKCYSWSWAGQERRWAPPALPQPGTISYTVRVREELAV